MNHGHHRHTQWITAAFAALLLSGCGNPGDPQGDLADATYAKPAAQPTPAQKAVVRPERNTYVASDPTGALYLQWTDDGNGHLSGTVQTASPNQGNGQPVKSESASFTGTLNDYQVSIVINQGLGSSSTWTGSLNDERLTLHMPASDGTIATAVLLPGNVDSYNKAVVAMAGKVQSVRQGQADAASDARRSAELAEASDIVDRAYGELLNALGTGIDTSKLAGPLSDARRDLAITIADAKKAHQISDEVEACQMATTASQDAVAVSQDSVSLDGEVVSISMTTEDVRNKTRTLNDKYQQLIAVSQRLGEPEDKQQAKTIHALTAKASKAAKVADSKAAAAQASMKPLDEEAQATADKAGVDVC